MQIPFFINSRVKLAWWILYTAFISAIVIVSTLSLLALTVSPLAWCLLLAAPVLLLLGYYIQHGLIHKKIIKQPNSTELNAEHPFCAFPFLTANQVDDELNSLSVNPKELNQGAYHLCGVAAILYALAYSKPEILNTFASQFVQNPENVGLSLPTRCYSKDTKLSVMQLIMMAIKHSSNLTGYHPINETLEQIQGASLPKELVSWIGFFNHYLGVPKEKNCVEESLMLRNSNLQPLSWSHQTLLGGVYSNIHNTFDSPTAHFAALLKAYNSKASIILLISMNLCLKILGEKNPNAHSTLLGVEFSHYVYLNELYESGSDLKLQISTWGVCAKNQIPQDDFIHGFCGFLAWGAFDRSTEKQATSNDCELKSARESIYKSLPLNSVFNQGNPHQIENETEESRLAMVCN